ncbi:MAG: potassium channel family protein [Actinomycetota bacterium]
MLVAYRLRWALAAALALAVVATVGYVIIEHYSWNDAVYMTVITLGTVGYGEVRPLHTGGRLLTMGVIIGGFLTLVYMASVLTNLFASGEATQHMRTRRTVRMASELKHHVIVVGFGRAGQAVVRALVKRGKQCVVIDINPEHEPTITAAGAMQIIGNATNHEDLARAGIERADALVAAADQDSENLVIVLTARSTRADLRIISRVNQASWLHRIKQAGADVAESPYESYGERLVGFALAASAD